MSYGLLSALSWGISTLLAAVAARRIGALRTLVLGETAGLSGYLTLFFLGNFSLRGVGSTAWLLVLAGVIAVTGYLAMYRGLESGHVGLVSAITACYGGVIAVLSVVLLHEQLTAAAALGIAATVVGVMLAVLRRAAARPPGGSADAEPAASAGAPPAASAGALPAASAGAPPAASAGAPPAASAGAPPAASAGALPAASAGALPAASAGSLPSAPAVGVAFGLVAALCYGVGGFMIGRYTRDLGWLVPVVVARGGAMVLLLGLLATPLRGPAGTRRASGAAWALAAGLADAAGLVFFARGDQVGLVAVTAAVSSAYPIIPLIGGVLVFRERMARQQIGGAILILAGLVLLGLGS
jgi:drug/metabolite transporter (DMT)-like permease